MLNGRSKLMWRLERRCKGWPGALALTRRYIVALTACSVPIGLAFTAATFPGEWADEWIGKRQTIPPNRVTAMFGIKDWTSFHDLLFNGKVDAYTRRRKSPFSNTLALPGFDALEAAKIDDPRKLDWTKHPLTLRGRHLEEAVLAFTDLRKADLEGAQLQGATLWDAQLQGASLEDAHLQGASLDRASLQGASLEGAQLQGATLFAAQLQGATLSAAQLQGAALDSAQLQGAELGGAQLQGASLFKSQLQGADFSPKSQGATLAGTDMRDAEVWRANFKGVSMDAVFKDHLAESAISKADFGVLQAMIMKEVREGDQRERTLIQIKNLDPDIPFNETSAAEIAEKGYADEDEYHRALAEQLKCLACSGDADTVYIVRGVIANNRVQVTGAEAPGLVEAILKPACPVSATLTEADKAALNKIKIAKAAH